MSTAARYAVAGFAPDLRVYEVSGWREVASCTSEIAAWAVWRLMHVDWLRDAMDRGYALHEGKSGDPRPNLDDDGTGDAGR